MFLTDPALRRIAADTHDVLPEPLWRHDTATLNPIGDLARLLHTTARDFTDSTTALDAALLRVDALASRGRRGLAARADIHIAGYQQTLTDALAARERHLVLGAMLVTAYRAWRSHRPVLGSSDERHLLLYRGDPSRGVATLRLKDPGTWLVVPDAEAASAFTIPYPDRVVGEVTETEQGWAPTAYTDPQHRQIQSGMTYPLPVCDDLASACRSLLRWWHLRHSDAWRSRTPAQLTPAELAHLAS
ncbi:hypothetical protein [Micromonospora maris]|uniref:Uncharacterized protein n=1 Tax=Micromonospora maris TaxID=1003110 RepID=A0A9X0HZ78_9ACTN|nr:hypothetical protein [Micromonospora maris]AEB44286.1 hypothetical protein VAB18032_15880 [Micromonospora maris AB-18-032]KUJ43833.1 hypothetical protein ADL17_11215 [Micromonospora maris]